MRRLSRLGRLRSGLDRDPAQITADAGGDPTLTNWNMRKTFVHEVGHSAGLQHSAGTNAMITGHVATTSWLWLSYDAHQRCHIDNWILNLNWQAPC